MIEAWRQEYNESRPHRALGERTPNEIANEFAASRELIGQTNCRKLTLRVIQEKGTDQFIATAIPIDTILRVQAVNTRQLQFAIDQLEKLQELRKSSPTDGAREDFDELQDLEPQETEAEDSILPASEVCEGENCETNPNLTGEDEPIEPE